MSWTQTRAYKARKAMAIANEKKLLDALKHMPKNEYGYVVCNYRVLANRSGIARGAINGILKRLERKGMIEISTSYKHISSQHEKAMKILEVENV